MNLTNFEKVTNKLLEVEAVITDSIYVDANELSKGMRVEFWNISGKGLIVCGYDDGTCGLYSFVGAENAPVEKDLEFIEAYESEPLEKVEKGCNVCGESSCFLHCPYCGKEDCPSNCE